MRPLAPRRGPRPPSFSAFRLAASGPRTNRRVRSRPASTRTKPRSTTPRRSSSTWAARPRSGWSATAYSRLLPAQAHLPETLQRRWTYYALYPNTFFDIYPEHMDFFQIIPVASGKSILRGRSYSLPEHRESRLLTAVKYLNSRINQRVQREDNQLTKSVQQGLASSGYERGILSDKEKLVKHFDDYIRRKIPEANYLNPPAQGRHTEGA